MPEPVERYDPPGIDYAWIMQMTFVLTILLGAPVVGLASWSVSLPSWEARARFAVGLGAVIWFMLAIGLFLYQRRLHGR